MDGHPTSCFKAPFSPNHLEPHGEPYPDVSAVPSLIFSLIILIIRGRRTRQVGQRVAGRSRPPCAGGSFLSSEDVDLPGEWGQLLSTWARDAVPVYMSQHDHCLRSHIRPEASEPMDMCTLHSRTRLPVQHQMANVQSPVLMQCEA